MRRAALALAAASSLMLAACAGAPALDLPPGSPPLAIEQFFPGRTEGRGVFTNHLTGYTRGFNVVIAGTWEGDTLTLVEDFVYDDGVAERKRWVLRKLPDGTWTGRREDVVGEATGAQDGLLFRLAYTMDIPGEWGTFRVQFRDAMGLTPDGTLINIANVGWLGLSIGTVELTLQRSPGA